METRIYPSARVAFVRHTGALAGQGIIGLWQRVDDAFLRAGIDRPAARFGICVDDPAIVPVERCRYDACVAVADAFEPTAGLRITTLPGGRYDCLRFRGSESEFADAWQRFFAQWLPQNRHRYDPSRAPMEVFPVEPVDARRLAVACDLCLPTHS